ncbi:MAG: carboxypeptidase-like regulatory domain-containing protein [Chloroflexota bacterium]
MDRTADRAICAHGAGAAPPDDRAATQRELLAHVTYDTRSTPMPLGVRAVAQRARTLLFAAQDYEVMLQVSSEATPDRLKLIGQVMSCGMPVTQARVAVNGAGLALHDFSDDDGQFRFGDVPWGSYELAVTAGDATVHCTASGLGPR